MAQLAVLTAPDDQVYREDRRGRCAWVDCPERPTARFCRKHRAWRLARNQVKVRTALLVRIVSIELEQAGFPVVAP